MEKWTFGFDKLEEHIKRYPPEEVEKITLVPSQAIREVARLYATIKPACIESGTNTLEEQGNAVQTCRAIAILQAVTGNFMVSGGYIATSRVHKHSLRLLDLVKEKPLGTDRFPLFYALWGRLLGEGEGQAMLVPNAILTGKPYPIKVMIVSGSNILLSWPNSNKVREALSKLDFLVVMDLFMTETAKQADIVLPAASGFERNEVFDFYTVLYPITYIMMRRKFLQIGECWPDMKLYIELAKRMGYEEYFPWKTMEEVVDYTYEPAGISIKRLTEEEPGGLSYGYLRNNKDYERLGFPTPSGKVEIYSKLLEELGHDPLPTFKEPIESPISRPDLAKDYPLILSTGTRKYPFMHSQFHQIPRLRKMAPEAFIEVHPDTAAKYGLRDGETAIVETKRGSIESKVKATEDIMPDLVSIACGWEEANANILTDETSADPMSGFPSLRAQLCRIRKK